jgi:hypothetical protein
MTWSLGLQAAPLHNQAKTEGRTFFARLYDFLFDGQHYFWVWEWVDLSL